MKKLDRLNAIVGNYDAVTADSAIEINEKVELLLGAFIKHAQFQDEMVLALLNEVKALREEMNSR